MEASLAKKKKLPEEEIVICYVAEAADKRCKGLIIMQAPVGFQGGPAERGEILLPGGVRLAVATVTHTGKVTPEAVAYRRLKYTAKGKIRTSDSSLHIEEPPMPILEPLEESTPMVL